MSSAAGYSGTPPAEKDVIRDVVLPTGLVNPTTAQRAAVPEVCAIDATWSGLKLVVRKELR